MDFFYAMVFASANQEAPEFFIHIIINEIANCVPRNKVQRKTRKSLQNQGKTPSITTSWQDLRFLTLPH